MSKRWYIEYYSDGIRHQVAGGFGMPGQGNRIKSRIERGKWFDELRDRVAAALEGFAAPAPALVMRAPSLITAIDTVTDAKAGRVSVRGIRNIVTAVTHFVGYIGADLQVTEVTRQHVAAFLASLDVSNSTRNNYRRDLHAFFSCLIENEVLQINPVSAVKRYKEQTKSNVAYTPDELQALMLAASVAYPRLHICMALMFYAFLRPNNEARLMQGRYFDFVKGSVTAPRTKTGIRHTVPMSPELREILMHYNVHLLRPDEYLFDNSGEAVNIDYFKTVWGRLRARYPDLIQQHQTMYSVRHTAACMLYDKTKDAEKVRRAFGHQSLNTTLVYLRSLGRFVGGITEEELPSL